MTQIVNKSGKVWYFSWFRTKD